MTAYYNEIDPYAAQWLRNLIAAGHIAPGDVDERSIVDVRADDLRGYVQCHFFAGIGGWSYALRLAGWGDDRPVWTGSCPCQPFSAAGAGKAGDDERHLWPAWFPLIRERRPAVVFGEQVEAAIGWGWLDAVFSDLEGEGYACGASVLPACSVGAPHIRQRTWFVADASLEGGRRHARAVSSAEDEGQVPRFPAWRVFDEFVAHGSMRGLADAVHPGRAERRAIAGRRSIAGRGIVGELADTARPDQRRHCGGARSATNAHEGEARSPHGDFAGGPSAVDWTEAEWLACTDGKARPVEPGTFPLAHGIPGRVGRLRAYGNAIVPQVAAEFILAASEAIAA